MSTAKVASRSRSPIAASKTRLRGSAPIRRKSKMGKSLHLANSSLFPALPKGKVVKVGEVRNLLGVSQDELARITGYSIRAVAGWEAGKKLSEAARQKLVETERLRAALTELMPAAELGEWMRTPNPAFEGQSPIQVIERGEADRIWRMIIQIDSGVAN
ncbi:MAG: XRE family transcriptional regulator [Gemmataceae bacterium]|nr:XRE family transcriptional regulator [Gemmataceae bacterium]